MEKSILIRIWYAACGFYIIRNHLVLHLYRTAIYHTEKCTRIKLYHLPGRSATYTRCYRCDYSVGALCIYNRGLITRCQTRSIIGLPAYSKKSIRTQSDGQRRLTQSTSYAYCDVYRIKAYGLCRFLYRSDCIDHHTHHIRVRCL